MTDNFNTLFQAERAAHREAQRLSALEWRWNRRFEIWRHYTADPAVRRRADALAKRARAARLMHEMADCVLLDLWERLSADLRPEDFFARAACLTYHAELVAEPPPPGATIQ